MPTHVMRAIRVNEYGTPDVMRMERIDRPEPGHGQVLIRIGAAGVNPIDWKLRSGAYRSFMPLTFPWTPGIDLAGTVESVGEGVDSVSKGQIVFGLGRGTYAEYAIAKEKDILPLPETLEMLEGATLGVGGLTALGAIRTAHVGPGTRVLIHGAAGGVGYFALQIALSLGAQVYATTSSINRDFVKSMGAEQVVEYDKTAFEDQLSNLDAVIDTVGGSTHERSYQVLRKKGIIATIVAEPNQELAKHFDIVAERTGQAPTSELPRIVELVAAGKLKPMVGNVFSLEAAADAHRLSEGRHGRGRIVLAL